MKLEKVLERMGSLEKNSFFRIIDNITSIKEKENKEIKSILDSFDRNLKNADYYNITKLYNLIENDYIELIRDELTKTCSQFDIIIDIFIRDGNCIMSHDWFSVLYKREINTTRKKVELMNKTINESNQSIQNKRIRDYQIYQNCVKTAFFNDVENNCDPKITSDELSILTTLVNSLGLSQEEVRLINYSTVKLTPVNVDDLIKDLRNIGVILFSKKENMIYIPDEIVKTLRDVRGKEIADKHFRKVLKHLKDSQINLIARKHNIERKLSREEKIDAIINEGIRFSTILLFSIYKDNVTMTEMKKTINELIEDELKIVLPVKGITANDKVCNLISYFNQLDKDEKVSTSKDGYEKLLTDINDVLPKFNEKIRKIFELQEEFVLSSDYLLNYNIKPRDILYIMNGNQIKKFCNDMGISTRGDEIENIIKSYKDTENIFLENYVNVGNRDLNVLKENGIQIKEAELGVKFEDLTKIILSQMGLNVDEDLRKTINTKRDKIDILLNLENSGLILIECKTLKDKDLNKYSKVKRQLKAYVELVEKNEMNVIKSLIVAPEFSDDFENECALEYQLNVSLITAESLKNVFDAFKKSKLNQFPYKLLLKDVVIKEERIIKAINKP